ncbi:MAG: TetR/AcrR family transcriptional regulator [Firmicutes bacterium]|nr:TetR/AcrR family transcriptional regulator [Bacillota bacterium]
MDVSKRQSIINAAMREFRYGLKKASTDNIVREAGISKGLLFHYFDTKERLGKYLIDYALDIMQNEYFNVLNTGRQNILDTFKQIALLKKGIAEKHPYIFDFLFGMEAHTSDNPSAGKLALYNQKNQEIMERLYGQRGKLLFRQGIDHKKAINIIYWTVDGLVKSAITHERDGKINNDFLERLEEYLDIFRKCLYKNEEQEFIK